MRCKAVPQCCSNLERPRLFGIRAAVSGCAIEAAFTLIASHPSWHSDCMVFISHDNVMGDGNYTRCDLPSRVPDSTHCLPTRQAARHKPEAADSEDTASDGRREKAGETIWKTAPEYFVLFLWYVVEEVVEIVRCTLLLTTHNNNNNNYNDKLVPATGNIDDG